MNRVSLPFVSEWGNIYCNSYFTGKDRVFNTPLSEQGIVAFGIGMAVTFTVILILQGKTECLIHHLVNRVLLPLVSEWL